MKDYLEWNCGQGFFYSQKPLPDAPESEGIDCSRLMFLAFKWAGAFVHRTTAARMFRGEGGWTGFIVTVPDAVELDLAFTAKEKHVVIKWNEREIAHSGSKGPRIVPYGPYWKRHLKSARRIILRPSGWDIQPDR